jgi:hypothetical protein
LHLYGRNGADRSARARSAAAAAPDAGNAGSPSRQPPGENRDRHVERTGEEGDPEQLEKWKANATRITLADGEPKSLTLKLNQ